MLVKVGDKVYDPNEIPVMVILHPQDKINIRDMPEYNTKYCEYPADMMTKDEIKSWMRDVPDTNSFKIKSNLTKESNT